ncbi:MAG: L-asparaginase [Acidobacteria bacterium]|nr:MAG: L-asparaginase [Acidobacteriota bacterium]PYS08785.1 MAG: L-asparaginase [Acidobacteriota bacterium]
MLKRFTISVVLLGFIFILSSILSRVGAQAPVESPRVLIIATGGTIAGEQGEPGTLGGYDIRKPIGEIVAGVPEIRRYAQVEATQFANIPSAYITPDQWLQLARNINSIFEKRPEIAGIVVTHGTDRLEETAFFLHLTVKSEKPVVIVGAQRPPTGISPDGPINLLSAVRVAASHGARGKGVLVVMDDRIISARDAEKAYARTGGFSGREMGNLGIVARHGVEFFYAPTRRHTSGSEFDVRDITTFSRVDIQYSYAGSDGGGKTDAKAIIVATTGLGGAERNYYEALQRKGVIIATTFPSGDQVASPSSAREALPIIAVERLLPTHARILMMLALTKTQDIHEIQRIFDQY